MTQDSASFADPIPIMATAGGGEPVQIDLLALIRGAAGRWRTAVVVLLGVFALTAAIFHLLPSRYKAVAEILMYDPERPTDIVGRDGSTRQDFDTVAMNTQIQVIGSMALANRVISDLHLDQVPEFRHKPFLSRIQRDLKQTVLDNVICPFGRITSVDMGEACPAEGDVKAAEGQHPEVAHGAAPPDLFQALHDHITITRVPLTYVLSVSAWSSDPKLARALASTIVNDYLADQSEVRKKVLTEQSVWLKSRIAELKDRIADNGEKIAALSSSGAIEGSGSASLVTEQIARLNEQVLAARADVAEKQAKYEQASQALASGATVTSGTNDASSQVAQLVTQRSVLSRQAAMMSEKLGPEHAQVIALRGQLAELDRAINDERQRYVSQLKADYEVSVRRQTSIWQDLKQVMAQRSNSTAYFKVQELERTQTVDRTQYDALLTRFNQIETLRSADLSEKRVISPAGLPSSPYFPAPKLFFGGGIVAGLLLGALTALAMEFFWGSRAYEGQAGRMLGFPVIAGLPMLAASAAKKSNGRDLPSIPPFGRSEVMVARAMRDVRIAIRMTVDDRAPMTVMITAPCSRTGVSTVASLLAASLVSAGHSAVVVRCEFWRPDADNNDREPAGVVDVLNGKIALPSAIIRDGRFRFDRIAPGHVNVRTDDLLVSKRMVEFLRGLRARYDYVVIDAPPVDAGAGVSALAGMVDKILVVTDVDALRSKKGRAALAILAPFRRRIVGGLLNKAHVPPLPQFKVEQGVLLSGDFRNEQIPTLPLAVVAGQASGGGA